MIKIKTAKKERYISQFGHHIWVPITVYQYESPSGYVTAQLNAFCDQTSTLSSQVLVNKESISSLL